MSKEACFCGSFGRSCFQPAAVAATQKGRSWFSAKKSHAAKSAHQVEEPEAGRMIQSQVSNLVIGVVPRPVRITHATSDRVGACGAKLLNGFNQTPVAGRPTASLPVRAQSTRAARTRQARMFFPRKGSPAGDWSAPEKLDAQITANVRLHFFQFLRSLLRFGSGWGANPALQRL